MGKKKIDDVVVAGTEEADVTKEEVKADTPSMEVVSPVAVIPHRIIISDLIEGVTTKPVANENAREATQEVASSPNTINAFDNKGINIGGPFARTRMTVGKPTIVEEDAQLKKDDKASRRGIFTIWKDRPVKNVGDGINTYDVRNAKKKDGE